MKIEPFDHPLHVSVEATVHRSEVVSKVATAVRNVVEQVELQLSDRGLLLGESGDPRSLHTIYQGIRKRQTVNTVRRLLKRNRSGDETWLYLNKQAAYAGAVVVCEEEGESPLGPIKVTIRCPEMTRFIDWLTPG